MTSVHSNASLCPSATTVPIQYLFPRCLPCVSRRWTHNQTSSATMDMSRPIYLRKYAFPDPCLFLFIYLFICGWDYYCTTSQNIRHFFQHSVYGGEGWLGFPDLSSGQKPWWNWYLTPVVNFGETRRAQLAKSTLLTSTLGLLGFFRSFKVCSDAKERMRCGKQREAAAPIHS